MTFTPSGSWTAVDNARVTTAEKYQRNKQPRPMNHETNVSQMWAHTKQTTLQPP